MTFTPYRHRVPTEAARDRRRRFAATHSPDLHRRVTWARRERPWLGLRHALAEVRADAYFSDGDWTADDHENRPILHADGFFTVYGSCEQDDEPADCEDFLGTFTNDDGPDTIPHHGNDYHTYPRFRPANLIAETYAYYRRTMSAEAAMERAVYEADEDRRTAAELCNYFVKAEVYGPDGRLWGSSGLMTDATEWPSDRHSEDVAADAVGDALDEAERNLARKLGPNGRQIVAGMVAA